VVYALIALSTIAVSGVLAVKALIAGVVEHLEADDIPLSARPNFPALPQRRAPAPRTLVTSRTNDAPRAATAGGGGRRAAA
jgi:hypothetical protein